MRTLVLLTAILISQTISAKNASVKSASVADSLEAKFWNYFESKVDNLETFSHSVDLQMEVSSKLSDLFPGLGLGSVMSFVDGKKIPSIYITAYGNKSKFSTVTKLVGEAPKKFLVNAFGPPSFLNDNLTFNGKSIPTNQIGFSYTKNQQALDVTFYFPSTPSSADDQFNAAFQNLLMQYLGEFQFANLGAVEIKSADQKTVNQSIEKLKELKRIMTTEFNK